MAWDDISDLWWLQPSRQPRDSTRGLALGAQIAQNRTENQWREQQATMMMQQKRAEFQSKEAKTQGIAVMSSYMADVASRNAWTDPTARAGFYKLGAQYPQAIDDPTLQAMGQLFETATAREAQARQHERTATIIDLDKVDTYRDIAKELKGTHPELAERYERKAAILESTKVAPTEIIRHLPDGTVEIIKGPTTGAGGLTGAVQTGLQQKAYNSEDAVRSGLTLVQQVTPENFGIGANIKNLVFDKILANVDPRLANPERIEARQGMRIWAENSIAAMRKDSQINAAEERRMLQAMSGLDTITSAPEAKVQVASFMKTMQDVTRQANTRLGKPVPQVAWNEKEIQAALTEGIVSGFKAGITKDRAIELLNNLKAIEDARANK